VDDAAALPAYTDPNLLTDIRRYGEFDTGACYQCGSCTVSCQLVTDRASFPRKAIGYALLGLRRPLVGSLEPWLCHDCGECSLVCPREAEPRVSMMTVRRFLTAQYDWTGMASRILRSRAWYVGSLLFVGVLVLLLIVLYHVLYRAMAFGDFATTPFGMEHMFPTMTYFTLTVTLLPLCLLLSHGLRMWWLTMRPGRGESVPISAYVAQTWTFALHSIVQPLMRTCQDRSRWKWHWMLVLGVVMKLVILVFALRWFQTDQIYPLHHPQRWVGYLATVFIVLGAGQMLLCRIRGEREIRKTARLEDVMFPILLLLTAASGIAAHVLRYADLALACHYTYALHVVIATPMLMVEMPFGKWSHMIHRPLALYFLAVRERAWQEARAREGVGHAA
jgi:nitrate reductase gamma subunit